jgi:AcrR family transcriptional regulator
MGHKHSKDEILRGAIDEAFDGGLSQVSFGRVASRLGISDRVVVYYFPTKEDLIGEVLAALGLELQAALAPALRDRVAGHLELVRLMWPKLARPDTDPVFALYLEACGLAAIGREPFRSLVPVLLEGWLAWTSEHVDGDARHRRGEAEAALAIVDGLLLMRQLAGPGAANRAAKRLGVAGSKR